MSIERLSAAGSGLPAAAETRARTPTPMAGNSPAIRIAPSYLTASPDELVRPETIRKLREMLATTAVSDCPVTINRDEARAILDMLDTRRGLTKTWSRTLEWGIRYGGIAQRMAERSGFSGYVSWMERRRIEPMRQLLAQLATPSAIAEDELLDAS